MRKFSTLASRCAQAVPERLRIAVPLLMMAALYWLSALPGTPAPGDPALYLVFLWLPPSVQNVLHVPAYAALSWAWHWALETRLSAAGARAINACAIASGYGVLDEWHQSFVPGRFASLTDVTLDAAGALLGVWLAHRALRRTGGTSAATESHGNIRN